MADKLNADSKERIALDLMTLIVQSQINEGKNQSTDHYLAMYKQCLATVSSSSGASSPTGGKA